MCPDPHNCHFSWQFWETFLHTIKELLCSISLNFSLLHYQNCIFCYSLILFWYQVSPQSEASEDAEWRGEIVKISNFNNTFGTEYCTASLCTWSRGRGLGGGGIKTNKEMSKFVQFLFSNTDILTFWFYPRTTLLRLLAKIIKHFTDDINLALLIISWLQSFTDWVDWENEGTMYVGTVKA